MKSKKQDIEISNYPSKAWETFITNGKKFVEIEVSKWRMAEILGYFMFRFQEAFDKEYQWKFNAAPSKAYEVFRMNTVSSRLSSNPQILKDYIDWIFSQRVAKDKKSFRSISFLTNDENLLFYRNTFLFAGQTNLQIDRSTPLPPNIKPIVSSLGCNTFGDLAFIFKAGLDTEEIKTAKQQLTEAKFDFAILDKIV
jgi:hypothetical protein